MDILWGKVKNVVDGDTFVLEVTHETEANEQDYGAEETVYIRRVDADELPEGYMDKLALERTLLGKRVRLRVFTRDPEGRVVATVKVIGQKAKPWDGGWRQRG